MAGGKKDDRYECLADSLAEESLSEAADTLFGERRRIEEALRDYQDKVQRLHELHSSVAACLANLHFVLRRGDPKTVAGFFWAVGIDPDQLPTPGPDISANPARLQVPFGLWAGRRYAGLVRQAYAALVAEASDYMQGRYYPDPEDPRCMRVTVNYWQVKDLCDKLQERITKANQSESFTQALQFSKRLDVARTEKETLAGGGPVQYTLDKEMAFKPPDFSESGLPAYPDLPQPEQVKKAVKGYAVQVFRNAPREVRSILREVQKAH